MPATALVCPHCEKPVEVQVTGVTRSRPCPACGEMIMLQVAEKGKKAKRRALLMGGAVPEVPTERTINLPKAKAEKAPASPPAAPQAKSPAEATARIAETKDAPPPPVPKARKVVAFEPQHLPDTRPAIPGVPVESVPPPAALAQASHAESADKTPPSPPTTGSLPRTMVLQPSQEPRIFGGDAFERMRLDPEVKEFRRKLIVGTCTVIGIVLVTILINWLVGGESSPATAPASKIDDTPLVMAQEDEPPPPVPAGSLVFKPTGKDDFQRTAAAPVTSPGLTSSQISMDAAMSVQVLRKFLAAPTWKERAAWSRPVPDLAKKMEAFYAAHADGAITFDNVVESREAKDDFFLHTVVFEGGGRRTAHVQKTASGPRVDWESFVGLGEMDWSAFMEQRPAAPVVMRVMVKEGHYYENQFGSPRLLKCLELRTVTEPGAKVIMGYLERDSTLTRQIEAWQRQAEAAEVPMILRLKYPIDSRSPTQVWVAEAVRPGWLIE